MVDRTDKNIISVSKAYHTEAHGDKPREGGSHEEEGDDNCKELRLTKVEIENYSLPWKVVTFYTTSDALFLLAPVMIIKEISFCIMERVIERTNDRDFILYRIMRERING